MLEYSKNYSVGRGTDHPFEVVGAGWINGPRLAAYLNQRRIPGVRAYPLKFEPKSGALAQQKVDGVGFLVTDRDRYSAARLGLELMAGIEKLHPGKIDWKTNAKLIANRAVMDLLARGAAADTILSRLHGPVSEFLAIRQKYLLY
jgi:uncharacterized protein YbbC (DUF1343 family)